MSGSTASTSPTGSPSPATPRTTASNTTPSAPTKPSPGTGRPTSTSATRTARSPTLTEPNLCHLLDAGHYHLLTAAGSAGNDRSTDTPDRLEKADAVPLALAYSSPS